jgi:hypothetical protein
MNLDLVAFLEGQGFDDGCRKANSQAISPFGDLHCKLPWIYKQNMYI